MSLRPSDLLAALRQAARSLARTPGFTAAVLATFALGIGVNTAVFSAAWSLLYAPLPVRDPDRLVAIYETHEAEQRRPVAPANFLDWRREAKSLAGAASYFQLDQVLEIGGEPRRIPVAKVSSQFFDLLGAAPAAGRFFHGGEERPLAVVSRRFFEEQLGGGAVEGRMLRLDGESVEVVGLAPASLDLPAGTAIWTLAPRDVAGLPMVRELDPVTLRDARYLGVYARLAPGATLASANAELTAIAQRLEAAWPSENQGCGVRAFGLAEDLGESVARPVVLLGAGAVSILLITCSNVAGLLLARGLGRRRDAALRAALGAGRGAILGHTAAETGLLALLGGALGIALAAWGAPLLVGLLPGAETAGRSVGLPFAVVAFATLIAIAAAAVAALAPALAALRVPPLAALAASRGAIGAAPNRLRSTLVVTQAALAVLLVAGALLLARTLGRLVAIDPGFDPAGVLTIRLWVPSRADFPPPRRAALLAQAVDAAAATPGVATAGAILKLPLSGASFSAGARVEGRTFAPGEQPDVCWRVVTADYFRTLRIPIVAGRAFAPADDGPGPLVGVVNQTLARLLWPGEDPIGRHLATGLDSRQDWVTVIGVVGDTPQQNLITPARPELYRPLLQENRFGSETVALAVRTGPGFSSEALRSRLRAVSPELVLESDLPLARLLARATGRERLLGALLGVFGGLALLLAGVGLYGVLAMLVAERRREMGVRLAVGATARDLAALVLRRGAAQAALGALIALPLALAGGRLLRGWLWQVSPADPWSLGGAVAALALVAAVASWLPARRAARTDPATVLRED